MAIFEDILQRTPPGLIYHYTSQTGLLGILKNKCIWATNIHYQNDSKEFQHALELSKEVIDSLRDNNPSGEEERLLRALKQTLYSIQTIHIYVSSFSEHKDMLSQWRGYCPRGNGFSIGLDFAQLKMAIEPQGFRLVPCVYEQYEQRQLVRELIDKALASFRIDLARSINIKRALRTRSAEFMNNMITLAPIIKHSTFSEEREWRAVSFPIPSDHSQVAYREGVSMLTPYFILNISTSNASVPIREVVVGPTPHMSLSISSVANFMIASNVPPSVTRSNIPFRGW
ncbi:MAG: DUF2971 domain-containing protein [Acidobacteriota bacterium]|nr:DUF2971 domain-containing protein [Acidobacteriota bacterium]